MAYTFEELDKLPSKELHDMAVTHARKHLDIGFLWDLVKAVPVAEAAAGHIGEAESDVVKLSALITDVVTADDEDPVADNLRPLYIDYLVNHSTKHDD
jgi:hypothetical protein